jgi:DNA topoisomerase-1
LRNWVSGDHQPTRPTISTVLKRGYVEKRDKEGLLRDYRVLVLKGEHISKKTEQETTGRNGLNYFPQISVWW